MQVTSYWLSDTGLLLLRCIEFVFFAVTLTLEATTGAARLKPLMFELAPLTGILRVHGSQLSRDLLKGADALFIFYTTQNASADVIMLPQ